MITKKEARKDDYDEGYSHGYLDGYKKAELDYAVDFDELKTKIFAEVDGGTGDRYLNYNDVCDRISESIDEFISEVIDEEKSEDAL